MFAFFAFLHCVVIWLSKASMMKYILLETQISFQFLKLQVCRTEGTTEELPLPSCNSIFMVVNNFRTRNFVYVKNLSGELLS